MSTTGTITLHPNSRSVGLAHDLVLLVGRIGLAVLMRTPSSSTTSPAAASSVSGGSSSRPGFRWPR